VIDFIVKALLAAIIVAILIVGGLFIYGAVTGYREPHPSAHQAALERQEQESPAGQGEP
jgi:hypothetical protein